MKFEIIYDENEMDERYPDIDLPEGYYGDCYKSGWDANVHAQVYTEDNLKFVEGEVSQEDYDALVEEHGKDLVHILYIDEENPELVYEMGANNIDGMTYRLTLDRVVLEKGNKIWGYVIDKNGIYVDSLDDMIDYSYGDDYFVDGSEFGRAYVWHYLPDHISPMEMLIYDADGDLIEESGDDVYSTIEFDYDRRRAIAEHLENLDDIDMIDEDEDE